MKEQKMLRDFRIDIKEVSDEGTFTGILSVYDVVDLGGDLVEKGAFTKTLQENGGEIPCLWQHRDPIGRLKVADGESGLEVQGSLVLDVQQAREALALMKARVVTGMSIGYRVIKSKIEEGVRRLKEVALMEGSVVTFPMLPLAQVTSVKADEAKGDFEEEFDRAQTISLRTMMITSLWTALDSITWDDEMSSDEKITASDESITQFQKAYVSFLPRLFALWGEKRATPEQKAGRTISTATRARIEEAIGILKALLDPEEAGTSPEEGKAAGASGTGAATPKPTSNKPEPEPEIHSLLSNSISKRRAIALWTPKN